MSLLVTTATVVGILLFVSTWSAAKSALLPKTDFSSGPVFRMPRLLILLVVPVLDGVTVAIVVYAFSELSNGIWSSVVSLCVSAAIAGMLTCLFAMECATERVVISGGTLIKSSIGVRKEVELNDVVNLMWAFGYIGLMTTHGRVFIISGGVGWNGDLVRYLREHISDVHP